MSNKTDPILRDVIEEADYTKDILLLNMMDLYDNLTIKGFHTMLWIANQGFQSSYVMKTEDDVILHILWIGISDDVSPDGYDPGISTPFALPDPRLSIFRWNHSSSHWKPTSFYPKALYMTFQEPLERRTRSRRVAGSKLREVRCCHVATGSLILKNENMTGRDGYVFV
ncbi:hypothetical protein LSH36_2218g00020 [Paralvinella palmiformis]|uniref:Hexosyltransferase n=1 Tax=Paralvinella palmiformis TaxID=53620 RepID=A0AAD9IQQ5_9ANNE|nr:hypothetical protein LSH36_2218g00020 [Paralvinella palmiformis]